MENFESLTSIIKEFGIKKSILQIFEVNIDELSTFVQISHIPNLRDFCGTPCIIDSDDRRLFYKKESHYDNSQEVSKNTLEYNSSMSMMSMYSRDRGLTKYIGEHDTFHTSSDFILESNSKDIIESVDSKILESHDVDKLTSEFLQLSSDNSRESLAQDINSEPFTYLESETFEDLHENEF